MERICGGMVTVLVHGVHGTRIAREGGFGPWGAWAVLPGSLWSIMPRGIIPRGMGKKGACYAPRVFSFIRECACPQHTWLDIVHISYCNYEWVAVLKLSLNSKEFPD